MEFFIRIREDELAKVAALLKRPFLIFPVEVIPKETAKPKTAAKDAAIAHEGPTTLILKFARLGPEPFTPHALLQHCGDKGIPDSLYSTLSRLVRQGTLAKTRLDNGDKAFRLTGKGRDLAKAIP